MTTVLLGSAAIAGDVLRDEHGNKITTREQFEKQQARLLNTMLREVYGFAPGLPEKMTFHVVEKNADAMDGAATLKQIDITFTNNGKSLTMRLVLFTPNAVSKPVPTFLLICNRSKRNIDPTRQVKSEFWPAEEVIARGYGVAAFQVGDIDPDRDDGFLNGIHGIMDGGVRRPDSWATIAAWGWGASRCLDYFETDADVDATRVAVIGHSRGGKTSLYAGATDKRFAYVISSCSGCTGAALSKRCAGQRVEGINNEFPHWFCTNYKNWNDREGEMPFDQHFLTAAICPRPVYHGSASDDYGADPLGEYRCLVEAERAYALYGLGQIGDHEEFPANDTPRHARNMAYHVRTGEHDLKKWDWIQYMNYADKVLRNQLPTVTFATPVPGSICAVGEPVLVTANAVDPDGTIGCVELWVDGKLVRSDCTAPFEWGRETDKDAALRELGLGTHTLKLIAWDECGKSATSTATITITATAAAPACKVEKLRLIHATTGAVLSDLRDGERINLADPENPVNVEAITSGTAGSVQFVLNGTQIATDSGSRFCLTDLSRSSAWTPPAGAIVLEAVPFTSAGGGGNRGESHRVTLDVIDDDVAVTNLVLVDASTGSDISTLVDGQTVNLAETGYELSVRADTPSATRSVAFYLDGGYIRTENMTPYALFGDTTTGRYYPWDPGVGSVHVKASAYDQLYGRGVRGVERGVLMYFVDEPASAGLPTPWSQSDIGSTGLPGSSLAQDGAFVVSAAGSDIWGTADAFHYTWRKVSGDVMIQARVKDLQEADYWTKAGVMIRESLAADSRQVNMLLTPHVAALQFRESTGSSTEDTHISGSAPAWIRLVRQGSEFTGYVSTDGVNWRQVGSCTVAMSSAVHVGLSLSSHKTSALCRAEFADIMVTKIIVKPAAPLPAWSQCDIGSPGRAGATAIQNDAFSISASGADIWGTSDSFHYTYQRINGDGVIHARLKNLQSVHAWAKAGLMFRESLADDAKHVHVLLTPSVAALQARSSTGGSSASTHISAAAPAWIRLARSGDNFTGYISTDGNGWTKIGSYTVSMNTEAYVGLGVTSHDNARLCNAEFDKVTVTGSIDKPISKLLPARAPWTFVDVGAVGSKGVFRNDLNQGLVSMTTSGSGIEKNADSMSFAYKKITGDFTMVTRVVNLDLSDRWALGGLAVRNSLDAGAVNVSLVASAYYYGCTMQWRTTTGGSTASLVPAERGGIWPMQWLKLTRRGKTFSGYWSENGIDWKPLKSLTMAMNQDVYLGLAASARSASGMTNQAMFDNTVIR